MEPLKRKLEELKIKETKATKVDCTVCEQDLEEFYYANKEFQKFRSIVQQRILLHPQSVKPGRLVVVNTEGHRNVLGVVLQWKEKTYTTLVICEKKNEEDNDSLEITKDSEPKVSLKGPLWNDNLFLPEGTCSHEVLDLKADDIISVTTKILKISGDKIIDNWKKRQQPRFRQDPPSQLISTVTQELFRITESNPTGLPTLHPINDLNMRDTIIVESFQKLQTRQNSFKNFQCLNCTHFKSHFDQLSSILAFKDEKEEIQFLMSDDSLQLRLEYLQRIEVLKKVGFIDDQLTVQLKGRVACDISNHELLITELLFRNICTNLPAEEIVALLSCMVFEQKTSTECNLTESLKQGVESIKNIATQIGECQKECGMTEAVEDFVDRYRFGLVEVVYRWAQGTSFVEIMELTDVQEGIIVRTIQRLDELCRDIRNAAKVIGDPLLAQKMDSASTLIKRDIVFAASLYTS